MNPVDPNADELKKMARVLANSFFAMEAGESPKPEEEPEITAGELQLAHDLRAAGFGDVAAERARAAHARRKATEHWNRAEALQARIDAAKAEALDELVEAMRYSSLLWHPVDIRFIQARAKAIRAALTVDQPAPTPEPKSEAERASIEAMRLREALRSATELDEWGAGGKHENCYHGDHRCEPTPESHPLEQMGFTPLRPEPPHRDPEPFICGCGGNTHWSLAEVERSDARRDHFIFAPRPADENGKPYSQDRADYEGGQK